VSNDAMSNGNGSSVPSDWTGIEPGGIRPTMREMTPSAVGFGLVQSADVTRGNQRCERDAQPNRRFRRSSTGS
jgi:hypothetical protein